MKLLAGLKSAKRIVASLRVKVYCATPPWTELYCLQTATEDFQFNLIFKDNLVYLVCVKTIQLSLIDRLNRYKLRFDLASPQAFYV